MSQERIKQLLEEASAELELIKKFKDEKDLEIINKLRKGIIYNLKDIPESIKKNKDGFKQILKSPIFLPDVNMTKYIVEHGGIDFVLEMLEEDFNNILKYINYFPDGYRDDERIIINSLKKNISYYHCFPRLLNDKDFAIEIIKEIPEIYSIINNCYGGHNNKKFMMAYLIGSAKNKEELKKYRDYNILVKKLTEE